MQEKEKNRIPIFHLYRKDGTSLFFHPFEAEEKFIELMEKSEFEGKYGKEPRVESLTLFRTQLYRLIEERVKTWVSEIRFIPKFLISAGVFLGAYFFFSLIVRDPIPMVDEILISLGAAVLTYILLGRRDQRSDVTLKKRLALRTVVDRIMFTESAFVKKVEEALHRTESESTEKIIEYMMSPPEKDFSPEEEKDAVQLLRYLKKRFSSRDFKKQEKLVARLAVEREQEKDTRDRKILSVWAESKKIDIPLFAVYTRIKKNFEKVK